jgi:hypothetical protein
MKLLEAEPALAPGGQDVVKPEAPAPEPAAPAEAPRACASCGAPLEPEQDWCLACGTAAPGRLGGRPGWRSALAIALIATVLVAGAVMAAYAALNDDAAREASAPASADIAPVATPAPQTPAAEQPPVQATTAQGLPKVPSGRSGAGSAPPATPVDTAPAPTTSPPSATPTTQTPAQSTAPAEPTAQPIEVAEDAGHLYDPLQRARNAGTESKALDGNPQTEWAFSSSVPAEPGVGYYVTLDKARGIKELRLQTSTPGFKVEVYATDEATAPPQITDTRWAHIRDRADVKARQRIVLGEGTSQYRTVLLWFTEPPSGGDRIRLSELRLLG